jgi:hypothetical protein
MCSLVVQEIIHDGITFLSVRRTLTGSFTVREMMKNCFPIVFYS